MRTKKRLEILTALVSTSVAVSFYFTDPHWNVQNVLMGFAALVSIATLAVPPGWARRKWRKRP